jgi:hypothetical protein
MTYEQFKSEVEAISNYKILEMAQYELTKLCSTGGDSFTMSIPPQTTDTDIVFSQLIERFKFLEFRVNELAKDRLNQHPF